MIAHVEPFHAIAISRLAHEMRAAGQDVIHMEFGQPSTSAPAAAAADVDALRRVRLSDSDVTVEAPDLAQTLDERERLRAERDALDARLGDIDAAIRQRLGDARRLVCADWRVTRSLVSTQRVDTKALRSLYPEAAAACTATTTSDRMTVARSAR